MQRSGGGDELGMEELSEGAGVAEVGECGGGSISRTEWRGLGFILSIKTLWGKKKKKTFGRL